LRRRGAVRVPAKEVESFLSEFFALKESIPLELPGNLRIKETNVAPRPRLQLSPADDRLIGRVRFDYDGMIVEPKDPRELIFKSVSGGLLRRRLETERGELDFLKSLNLPGDSDSHYEIDPGKLAPLVEALAPRGWRVEGEAGAYRAPGKISLSVRTEVD